MQLVLISPLFFFLSIPLLNETHCFNIHMYREIVIGFLKSFENCKPTLATFEMLLKCFHFERKRNSKLIRRCIASTYIGLCSRIWREKRKKRKPHTQCLIYKQKYLHRCIWELSIRKQKIYINILSTCKFHRVENFHTNN